MKTQLELNKYLKKEWNMEARPFTEKEFPEWLAGGNWTLEELQEELEDGVWILKFLDSGLEFFCPADEIEDETVLGNYTYFNNLYKPQLEKK